MTLRVLDKVDSPTIPIGAVPVPQPGVALNRGGKVPQNSIDRREG